MKGILKKIGYGLVLASSVFAVFSLTSCDPYGTEERKTTGVTTNDKSTFLTDNYIVVEENGETTLHKGDVTTFYEYGSKTRWSHAIPSLKFDCAENEIFTSQFVAYGKEKPSEEKYDHECEECLAENE